MEGGSFFWGGGFAEILVKIDINSNSNPVVTGTLAGDNINGLALLDSFYSNELVLGVKNGKLISLDRTGALDAQNNPLRQLVTSRTKIKSFGRVKDMAWKVLFGSNAEPHLTMADFKTSSITETYSTPVCTTKVEGFSEIRGANLVQVICNDKQIHLVDLMTGTVSQSIASSPTSTAEGVLSLEGWRFTLSFGLTTSSEGEIKLWDVKSEVPCHGSCATCDLISTDKGCTSCSGAKVLRLDGSCESTCSDGEYASSPNQCSRCDPACKTCQSGGSSDCLSCVSPQVRRTDGSCEGSCAATKEYLMSPGICGGCHDTCLTCTKAGVNGCTSCPDGMGIIQDGSCVTEIDYSLSLLAEGREDSGEVSYYLQIKLLPKQNNFYLNQLLKFIENHHFSIVVEDLSTVGEVSYNNVTRELTQDGRVSSTLVNTIEYEVYKAPTVLPKDGGDFKLKVTPNGLGVSYLLGNQIITISKTPKNIVKTLPKLTGSMRIKAGFGRVLSNSATLMRIISAVVMVVSSAVLHKSLGIIAKFFQIIEVMMNLSLVNTKLGSFIDNVIEVLGSLKFPLALPDDLFWPDYVDDSHVLFWKDRFKLSVHEKQLFILCNETLMVIFYLFSWSFWLILLGVKGCCCSKRNSGDKGTQNQKTKPTMKKGDSFWVSCDFASFSNSEEKVDSEEDQLGSFTNPFSQNNPITKKKKIIKHKKSLEVFNGLPPLSIDRRVQKEKRISKKLFEEKKEEDKSALNEKENDDKTLKIEEKKQTIDKVIKFVEEMKLFFFSFSYFDVQFITFNELLHSDVTLMDGMWSRGAISYTISFVTLGLMIYDLRWLLLRSAELIKKKQKGIELTKEEEGEANFFFEGVKTDSGISFTSMNFTLISMLRFSLYQLIIASVQLSPNFQSGLLLTLQIAFFIFYINKYRKEKFFESCFTFTTFVVFEICITVFLLLSFIFSFENVGLWFNSTITAWLQILASVIIIFSVFVEFLSLMTHVIKTLIDFVKTECVKDRTKKNNKVHEKAKENSVRKNNETELLRKREKPEEKGGVNPQRNLDSRNPEQKPKQKPSEIQKINN